MTTISISVDEETKREMDQLAKEMRISRSDVVRELFARTRLQRTLEEMEDQAAPLLEKLGLETEDDIADFLKRH